jgi:hypothetical protein
LAKHVAVKVNTNIHGTPVDFVGGGYRIHIIENQVNEMSAFDKWIENRRQAIGDIDNIDDSKFDRLSLINSIKICWLACETTQHGWKKWLSSTSLLDHFPEEMLRDFLQNYRKLALKFLKFDISITEQAKPFFPSEQPQDPDPSLHA